MSAWRGADWDRISGPHVEMGTPALDRLDLRGDERVLDAGCGLAASSRSSAGDRAMPKP